MYMLQLWKIKYKLNIIPIINIIDIIMPTNDTCLLCLDKLNNNVSSPKYCDCKIYMHTNCMKLIENSGLACPICRIKMIKIYKMMKHKMNL